MTDHLTMRIAVLGGTGKEGSGLAMRWATLRDLVCSNSIGIPILSSFALILHAEVTLIIVLKTIFL